MVGHGHITGSLSGCAEEGGAFTPSHLKGFRNDQHGGFRRVKLGKDISKIPSCMGGDSHAPEAILEVNLSKEEGTGGVGVCHDPDETGDDIAKFKHGVLWCKRLV